MGFTVYIEKKLYTQTMVLVLNLISQKNVDTDRFSTVKSKQLKVNRIKYITQFMCTGIVYRVYNI